jgi:hypothetical protein
MAPRNSKAAPGKAAKQGDNDADTSEMNLTTPAAVNPLSMSMSMSAKEADRLDRLIRQRAKLANLDADARAAQLKAELEEQLARIEAADDARWVRFLEIADAVVAEGNQKIREILREEGVPESFKPQMVLSWRGRGENANKERRAELRRVGGTMIDALAKQAKARIAEDALRLSTDLLARSLTGEAAQAWLAALPEKIESAMPLPTIEEVTQGLRAVERQRHHYYSLSEPDDRRQISGP